MLPIHVINLARRPVRLAHMESELARLGLDWQRVEAIDARGRDVRDLAAEFGSGPLSRLFPATPGDIACSLTHQRLWRKIAVSAAEAAIILEDDARLSGQFAQVASGDVAGFMLRNGMGALKLEFWPGPQKSRRFPVGEDLGALTKDIRLYRMRSSFLGTCGYVLTKPAARALLEGFPHLRVPVDHFLFGREADCGFRMLRPGFTNPAPVLHDVGAFGSDIRADRDVAQPDAAQRGLRRRLRDWRCARAQSREVRGGLARVVEMRPADDLAK